MVLAVVRIFLLSFVQGIGFSVVSRSRNRDNKWYHIIASVFSNGLWFLTFRELVKSDMDYTLLVPYILGTVIGSVYGMKISMKIESWLGASADGHLKKK